MKPIQFRGKETMSYNNDPLPPAEGAEQLLKRKYADDKWEPNFSGIIEVMTEFAAQQHPTADGAEEILIDDIEAIADKYEIVERIDDDPDTGNMRFVINDQFVELVRIASVKFATLHARKMARENLREELIKYHDWIFDDEFAERSVNEYLKSKEQ